jgi:tRNA(Ile)-lysidine synthase
MSRSSREPDIVRRVEAQLAFLPRDERCLAGVSGGRDSMVLMHLLRTLEFRDVVVCHLDHGIPRDSRADAQFVKTEAASAGYRSLLGKRNVPKISRETGESIETAGRRVRYDFFARCVKREQCRTLLLAHHADDQVETFLFNLLRGSGAAGLSAMRPRSARKIGRVEFEVVRPLLGIWRHEIDAYVKAHSVPYREDPTNAELSQTRNRIRHTLLPAMSDALGRDVRQAVWRAAEIIGEEDACLRRVVEEMALEDRLACAALRELPPALQRRLIHRWMVQCGAVTPRFDEVEQVRAMLAQRGPAKVNLTGGRHARRRSGRIWIE